MNKSFRVCFEFEEVNDYIITVSFDSNLRKGMQLSMAKCAGVTCELLNTEFNT